MLVVDFSEISKSLDHPADNKLCCWRGQAGKLLANMFKNRDHRRVGKACQSSNHGCQIFTQWVEVR